MIGESRAPERLSAVGDENGMNGLGIGNRQKTATPMLAALAPQEIAIRRVVVLAEDPVARAGR
jgi:hypothetical protein